MSFRHLPAGGQHLQTAVGDGWQICWGWGRMAALVQTVAAVMLKSLMMIVLLLFLQKQNDRPKIVDALELFGVCAVPRKFAKTIKCSCSGSSMTRGRAAWSAMACSLTVRLHILLQLPKHRQPQCPVPSPALLQRASWCVSQQWSGHSRLMTSPVLCRRCWTRTTTHCQDPWWP